MITRRDFVSAPILYLLSTNLGVLAGDAPEVFPQGIASGDPSSEKITLWTRINPKVHETMKKDLILEVSNSPDFSQSTRMSIPADRISPRMDYTVKLTLESLSPNRTFYYRFIYADVPSMVGRFRTLPVGEVSEYKIAFITCQNFADGYYSAFNHLAQEDVGFVIHLGDQIYEKIYGPPRVPGRELNLPSGRDIALSLEDYRYLYRTYLSDKNYQLVRAMYPFVYTWDDHEYANDYAYDYERGFYVLPGHPFFGKKEQSLTLRRIAISAWLTYTPARVKVNLRSDDPLKWITLYRDIKVGRLAHVIITDERSYRTPHPCERRYSFPGCPEQRKTSMLGKEQKEWFFKKLMEDGYVWKVWANGVQFVQSVINGLYGSLDAWDGYLGEREEIAQLLASEGASNLVILTGDRHAGVMAEVPAKFEKNYDKVLGVEFITPALSSISAAEGNWWRQYGVSNVDEYAQAEISQNPWIKFVGHKVWGYSVITLTNDRVIGEIVSVDKYLRDVEKVQRIKAVYEKGRPLMITS
ncbi:alkaline phosphatase D family protein [Thermocrinis sp.]